MPSLLPGYNYDIFISYRQKDNRADHWVTNFVKALREELDATFKDDVSIYFDENPHDGLLETHDVEDSLKDKLRSLILIPIISQTYCDPKSYAWNNEFLAFKKLASEDTLGLKVKLANGNVASRVLPVRIHELDETDRKTIESEIGPLRAIDFIFKSPGVNRSLRPTEEHPQDNLNNTFYRDQVNKVANAIKEIITRLRQESSGVPPEKSISSGNIEAQRPSPSRTKLLVAAAIIVGLSIAGYVFGPELLSSDNPAILEKSIAVLPFENISDDPAQGYISDGITDEIISRLSMIESLRVPGLSSVKHFNGKLQTLKEIAEELNVSVVLEGSVKKSGDKLRITTRLIDVANNRTLWTEVYDRSYLVNDIFEIQAFIAQSVADKFRVSISPEVNYRISTPPTTSTEAYDLYLRAISGSQIQAGLGVGVPINPTLQAEANLKEAIRIDPDFGEAYLELAIVYSSLFVLDPKRIGAGDSIRPLLNTAIEKDPGLAAAYTALASLSVGDTASHISYVLHGKTSIGKRAESWMKKALALDPANSLIAYANLSYQVGDIPTAVEYFDEAIRRYPNMSAGYMGKAKAYGVLDLQDSSRKYVEIARRVSPGNRDELRASLEMISLMMHLYVTRDDFTGFEKELRRYYFDDPYAVQYRMGIAYLFARKFDDADRHYRRSGYRDMDFGLLLLKTGRIDSGKAILNNALAFRGAYGDNQPFPLDNARLYAALGDKENAVKFFRKSIGSGFYDMGWFNSDPFLDYVRDYPPFHVEFLKLTKANSEMIRLIRENEKRVRSKE